MGLSLLVPDLILKALLVLLVGDSPLLYESLQLLFLLRELDQLYVHILCGLDHKNVLFLYRVEHLNQLVRFFEVEVYLLLIVLE